MYLNSFYSEIIKILKTRIIAVAGCSYASRLLEVIRSCFLEIERLRICDCVVWVAHPPCVCVDVL